MIKKKISHQSSCPFIWRDESGHLELILQFVLSASDHLKTRQIFYLPVTNQEPVYLWLSLVHDILLFISPCQYKLSLVKDSKMFLCVHHRLFTSRDDFSIYQHLQSMVVEQWKNHHPSKGSNEIGSTVIS